MKELWPEGMIITADAATLEAAAYHPSSSGSGTLLEEVCCCLLMRQTHLRMQKTEMRRPERLDLEMRSSFSVL